MALTSAQIAKQTEVLVGVRAAFNAAVVPVAAALNALPQNDVLTSAIGAWNNIVNVMNAGNTAAIRAALDATAVMVPSDPPVVTTTPLFANDLSSVALIQRDFIHAGVFYGTSPTINNPSVWIDGMLEVPIQVPLNSGPGIGGTGCSWHHALQVANELWLEYDFMVTLDVAAGMNENGIKLPGLCGGLDTAADGTWFSARMWHGRRFPDGRYPLAAYIYSAQQHETMESGGFGDIVLSTGWLTEGKRHKIGQHIKLNTPGVADGVLEMLLDGVSVYRDAKYKFRTNGVQIDDLFFNIFHGGTLPVTNRITFRVANVIVDNKPIPWKPPVIIDTGPPVPAWRKGLKVGVWTEGIPMTWGLEIDPFSGMASDRVNAMIYWPGPGGHAIGDGAPVYGLDLMADKLAIKTLLGTHLIRARTSVDNLAYWPDGEPTGAHLYYNGVVPIINGKPVVVRTLNSAAAYGSAAPPRTDAYHPDRNGWDLNGQGWGVPPTPSFESCVALDRRTNLIYTANSGNGWGILDANTGQWTRLPNGDKSPGWSGSVIDPRRGQHLFTRDDGSLGGRDLVTGVFATYASTVRCRAMVIQERFNRLFTIGYDSVFRGINLDTFAITDMGAVPQPSTVYNRIEDFPTLGGLLHLPGYGQPARFIATE